MRFIVGGVSVCLLLIFLLVNCNASEIEEGSQEAQSALSIKTDIPTSEPSTTIIPTPSPTITPSHTPVTVINPLLDFPLAVGNTWVYSSTHYETNTKTGQRITATYIITEQVMATKIYESYFTFHVHKDVSFLEGEQSEIARPSLERDFLYIVDNNFVYRQRNSTHFNPERFRTTRFLIYKFPLLKHTKCWHPGLSEEFQKELFGEGCPNWGYRYVDGLIEPSVPAGTFENCVEVVQADYGMVTNEWLCSGMGKVGEKMDYQGQMGFDPYQPRSGYEQVLITYTIQLP